MSDVVAGDATKVSVIAETVHDTAETAVEETASVQEQAAEDIEIVDINSDDEEDDEILNALDRYFEAPEAEAEKK